MAYQGEAQQESLEEPDMADQGAADLRNSFATSYNEDTADSGGRIVVSGDTSFGSLVDEEEDNNADDSLRHDK